MLVCIYVHAYSVLITAAQLALWSNVIFDESQVIRSSRAGGCASQGTVESSGGSSASPQAASQIISGILCVFVRVCIYV